MKRTIVAIIAFFGFFSNTFASDFFLDSINNSESQTIRISNIKLTSYSFKNTITQAKYRDSLYFIARVKRAVLLQYKNGSLSTYQFDTIANELEYLSYYLNNYFANMKNYEKTGSKIYRDMAAENIANAKSSYDRLKTFIRQQ